ncbi:MAG: glycosyltransferase family 4 protein [Desulfobacteraceae bacterium]|nr:glycosyltransferase family 4 protein [Desulfobacteraceae bacterium]
MKIAVILEHDILAGGGYHQALNMLLLLNERQCEKRQFVFITTLRSNIEILSTYGIQAHFLKLTLLNKILLRISRHPLCHRVLRKIRISNSFDKFLSKYNIDLIYFISPSGYALYTDKYNYIFTVWDLCHRDFVEFPEVRENRTFESREALYQHALTKAVAVIVDSELGKENVIRRYGVDPERVEILHFSPAPEIRLDDDTYLTGFVDIKQKYQINGDYIYYPAQFWAHKNHVYILKAIALLKEKHNIELYAVFSGADKGNLNHVMAVAEWLGIKHLVKYVGFVPNELIPHLYRQSLALVMPTYFGPTNIPPLEAFQLGVPVIYSDLPGLWEQVGDAALLVDLSNPQSLVNQLLSLLHQPELRKNLIEKGRHQLLQHTDEERWEVLESIFDRFSVKLSCWKI